MNTRNKLLILTALIFFVLINTNYYWEGALGILSIPVTLTLLLVFIILTVGILIQLYHLIKEKFQNRNRIFLTILLILIVTLTAFKPFGLVNFDKLQGEDLLIAYREGVANCMTTLKLKDNNRFYQRINCFGVSKLEGDYVVKDDTIYFDNVEFGGRTKDFYEFAIIEIPEDELINKKRLGSLSLYNYNNKSTKQDNFLIITKNDLNKNPASN